MGFWHDFKDYYGWTAAAPPSQSDRVRPAASKEAFATFPASLRDFARGIVSRGFWLVAGVVLGCVDLFERATGQTVDVPVGAFYAGAAFCLFMAQV